MKEYFKLKTRKSTGSAAGETGVPLESDKEREVTPEYSVTFYPDPGRENPTARYSNYIRTTKYTILTFLPLNLFQQFRRFYNLYFLLSAILAVAPTGATPVSPSTMVLPLVFVIGVTMIKDIYEDLQRYRADKKANNIQFQRLGKTGAREQVASKDLRPGDVVFIENEQQFPADLVVLSSNSPDGLCFIETANLDGETNLKRRTALPSTSLFDSDEGVRKLKGQVQCEGPNEYLYRFSGRLRFRVQGDEEEAVHALNADNILLRGARLRNTDFVYGVVLYVGMNTKIMRNLSSTALKFSSLEKQLNMLVGLIFLLNAILLGASIIGAGAWQAKNKGPHVVPDAPIPPYWAWYVDWPETGLMVAGLETMTYFIIWTYLIPISLFVTLEIVRLIQTIFMYYDDEMMSPEGVRMIPKNSNLNEELGKIQHIFSDKTGTLTQNIMNLEYWYVDGQSFAEKKDAQGSLIELVKAGNKRSEKVKHFLRVIGLCHGVIPSYNEKLKTIVYEGDSPDESALLEGARKNNLTVKERNQHHLVIEFMGIPETYEILKIIEFTSSRKMMSVIVRRPDGIIEILAKGADNVILDRIADDLDPKALESLTRAIDIFSSKGLRTLLVGSRILDVEEVNEFRAAYHKAETSLENREALMEEVAKMIEKDFQLDGATAVDDKLQEDVAETINYFLRCGITFWMLTGDKLETAISIGRSTKLLQDDMVLTPIHEEDEELVASMTEVALKKLRAANNPAKNALVVTGQALTYLLRKENLEKFLELGELCQSVICCRVSPLQKSLVVKAFKVKRKKICLAIGDGANDVSMIQEGNVGVGIIGLEGTQAVRAADYAFKEFRALKTLVVVHGRWSYMRMADTIFFSFYKNVAMILVQLWYGANSAWSGYLLYQDLFLTLYNLGFTALPPFILGCMEQDIEDRIIMQNPEAYREVRDGLYFNIRKPIYVLLSCGWHSVAVYYTLYFFYTGGIVTTNGLFFDVDSLSVLLSTIMLTVVLLKSVLMMRHWTIVHTIFYVIEIIGYIIFLYAVMPAWDVWYTGVAEFVAAVPSFYLVYIFAVVLALLPDFVGQYLVRQFRPADWMILQEEDMLNPAKNPKYGAYLKVYASSSQDSDTTFPDYLT